MSPVPGITSNIPAYQLRDGVEREWLLTNGRGDFASSTVLMCATRRYHGLLVAAPNGHVGRHMFLSRFEERLHGTGRSFAMSIARYRGLWHPHGHDGLVEFRRSPLPLFRYRFGQTTVTREILLVSGQPVSLSRYGIADPETEVTLELRPLLAFREADALTHENLDLSPRVERLGDSTFRVRPYSSLPALSLQVAASDFRFEADPVWYRGIEYPQDLERGYDGHEDQFSPGRFVIRMSSGSPVIVSAALDLVLDDPADTWERERARRGNTVGRPAPTRDRLADSADDFLYRRRDGSLGVMAGFPWFGEWGRDTFVSAPGLTIARGRTEACGEILRGAVDYLRSGLMPNTIDFSGQASAYNSADASLWFGWAVSQYDRAGAPPEEIMETFLPALTEIAVKYRDGTDLSIGTNDRHLLEAGSPRINATWMDARIGNQPVTPRNGCAVELNALWYALLAYLEELYSRKGDRWQEMAWRAHRENHGRAFRDAFWLPDEQYLADVWRPDAVDRCVRPNMVIAAALERSPLTRGQRLGVVRVAESQLLTPLGLRTLAPDEPGYVGRYSGGPRERDEAYHQGTVWPWLLGSYVEATLRAHEFDPVRAASLCAQLDGFAGQLDIGGLDHVSEVFDGDPPHHRGGAIAQAWSTAELLRAYALIEGAGS